MTRPFRLAAAVAGASGLLLVGLPVSGSSASEPGTSSLTVPTGDQVVEQTYQGTVRPDSSGAVVGCNDTNSDPHVATIVIPPGSLDGVTANLQFRINWEPVAVSNDLILTVLGPDGKEVGSSDGGTPREAVTLNEIVAGEYTALACGFVNETPQPYTGTIRLRTIPPNPGPRKTVESGLEFGPSLVTDPQRSQGESAAFADGQGVLYSCGTNGASNGTDHGSVSVDGGETWRALGTAPIGETGTAQGGGDCAIATGQDANAEGKRQLAFIGLGPLTGFSTFSSPDNGRTLNRSPDQNGLAKFNQQSLVDRQWLTFTDEDTVFLNYNAAIVSAPGGPEGQVVQKSDDGGLTYGPAFSVATDGNRLGQIRAIPQGVVPGVDPTKDVVYFPYNSGTEVKLAMSLDGGDNWSQCLAVDANIDPTAGFVAADHDQAGNLYVTYAEKGGGRDTYLVALRAADVQKCKGDNPVEMSVDNNVDPGFTDKIRMDVEGIETTVMPWVAAGGAPGRAAVAFYGTESDGNPDLGTFKATWHVYVTQVIDVFGTDPRIDQVQATTHPNHYDSICLNGLQCTIDNADRSLVDYFTMSHDPTTGRLLVVYNQAAKRPDDELGRIAAPVSMIQRAGPSNAGANVPLGLPVVRTGATDVQGDALTRWTTSDGVLGSPRLNQPSQELPALDLLDVKVGPQVDFDSGEVVPDGGLTVTMRYADLSTAELNKALQSGPGTSLVYLFRFFDGFQPGGATAHYEPAAGGWRFGYDDYTTSIRNPQGNVQTYKGSTPVPGKVDLETGTITLSVPREQIEALTGSQGPGERPTEETAVKGSRIYDASAWTFINPLPTSRIEQSFLFQSDNTAAFDFELGAVPGAGPGGTGAPAPTGGTAGTGATGATGAGAGSGAGSGTAAGASRRLPATGALPLLGVAALLTLGAGVAVARRRSAADSAQG